MNTSKMKEKVDLLKNSNGLEYSVVRNIALPILLCLLTNHFTVFFSWNEIENT